MRITPPEGKKKFSMQGDVEETMDGLWDVVQEKIINTEAARRQTTVNHQTNLVCRYMLHDNVLFSKFCFFSKCAEAVCPSESAESHIINGTSRPNMTVVSL